MKAVPSALQAFFSDHPRLALAFSGGTDSAYLLYATLACGCDVAAYCAVLAFQPAFEREDALRLADGLGAAVRLVPVDPLADDIIRANPADRCYHCKRAVFAALTAAARAEGYDTVIVRMYSREAGLFTWDKPAYACLATRVPTGTPLSAGLLGRIEGAEAALFRLGFSDFRCRVYHGAARLQFRADQLARAVERRPEIRAALAPYFDIILLDTEDRG